MRKVAAIITASMLTLTMLTGCGSSTSTTASTGATQGESKAEATEQAKEEPAESTSKSKVIVSTWESGGGIEFFNRLVEKFEEDNPQYEVEIIYTDALQYNDKIITMMAGGTECDVVFFKDCQSLSGCIDKGQIAPLNDYLAASSLEQDRFSGLIDELSIDGTVYGMPYRKDNTLIYYNKDKFDAEGVEYPKDGMTLQEFRDLAAKFVKADGGEQYGASTQTWGAMYTAFAGRTGKFTLSDPNTYDAEIPYLKTIVAMQDEDKSFKSYAEQVATGDKSQWANGLSAMTWLGTWFTSQIIPTGKSAVDFNWGVCSMPNDEGVVNEYGIGSVTPVTISKYSQNPEGAWAFIEYAVGPKGAKILAEDAILPAYTDETTLELICSTDGVPEGYGDYLNVEKMYLEAEMKPHMGDLGALLDQQISLIMTGTSSVDDAVAEWKSMAEDILNE